MLCVFALDAIHTHTDTTEWVPEKIVLFSRHGCFIANGHY